MAKTKVMKYTYDVAQQEKSGKWPCGVCNKGVGRNSIKCDSCKRWVHKKCSGIRGRLRAGMSFQCARCKNPKTSNKANTVLQQGVEFEQVDKFCYLGDMFQNGGGADAAVRTRVSCAWAKFRKLCPILAARGASL